MGGMEFSEGLVTRGINNIYTVMKDEQSFICRIKGKQLTSVKNEYNPIAVGDYVSFTADCQILARIERTNCFQRWNDKGRCNQTVVANMDQIAIVTSANTPPFRPRFIDRCIACCINVKPLIIMNKSDILLTEDEFARFSLFHTLGYRIIAVSSQSGENMDELKALLAGKKTAFIGQSGVGKSTLINTLLQSNQKTSDLCEKYNRGCHTTNHALMLFAGDMTIVDTPGVREILPPHGDAHRIAQSFPEFLEPAKRCAYDCCLHDNEPQCAVKKMVEEGKIDPDRYESYLRILESLKTMTPAWMKNEDNKSHKGQKYRYDDGSEE